MFSAIFPTKISPFDNFVEYSLNVKCDVHFGMLCILPDTDTVLPW